MGQLVRGAAALLLVVVLLAGSAPRIRADTDLLPGDLAIVAYTGGGLLFVRAGPGYDYTVLTRVAEGAVLTVLDGPIEGGDGNYWYEVDADGLVGFAFAEYLVLPENAPAYPSRAA